MSLLSGYRIQTGAKEAVLDWCLKARKSEGFKRILTLNPLIIMAGEKDSALKTWMQSADLIVADGVGVCWALKKEKNLKTQSVTGVDLVEMLLKQPVSVYLVGAKPDILALTVKNIKERYPTVGIVGAHHGYMTASERDAVIQDISEKSPDFVWVAMGIPYQEYFLQALAKHAKRGIGIGVGGTFDVLSGTLSRAPKWVQSLKIEWLYRAIRQPERFKKFPELLRFMSRVSLG